MFKVCTEEHKQNSKNLCFSFYFKKKVLIAGFIKIAALAHAVVS